LILINEAQGWEELLEALEKQRDRGEPLPEIAGFGSGEAEDSVRVAPRTYHLCSLLIYIADVCPCLLSSVFPR